MRERPPNFDNLRRTLLRQGEPDYVPLMEFGVDLDVKCAFLGRPVATLQDEVDFWYEAGYEHVPMQAGMRTIFWPGYTMTEKIFDRGREAGTALRKQSSTRYSLYHDGEQQMSWAQEGAGVIQTMEDFEHFPWPDPEQMDLSSFIEVQQYLRPGMKVAAVMGYVFTAAWWMMGMENFCIAAYEQPELVRRLYDRIWRVQSGVALRLLKMDAVGLLMHPDDLAYAEALIMSPKHYREFVFPWYRWCGAMVRDRGIPYVFHSDGRLNSVLDDILACGFNALHPIEPKAMDIVELKKKVGDRLCLIGNIDLGYTLTRGTPEEVEAEVRERIRTVGPGGGYCVGSSNSVTAYVPMENYQAMRRAVFTYGRYPISA